MDWEREVVWQGGVRCDSVAREEFKEPVSLGRKGFTWQMTLGEKDLKGLSALRLKSQLQSIPPSILSSILPLIVPSISLSIHQFVAVQDASTPIRPCTQPLRFQSAISFPPQSSNLPTPSPHAILPCDINVQFQSTLQPPRTSPNSLLHCVFHMR